MMNYVHVVLSHDGCYNCRFRSSKEESKTMRQVSGQHLLVSKPCISGQISYGHLQLPLLASQRALQMCPFPAFEFEFGPFDAILNKLFNC